MQQHNVNWRSLPSKNPEIATDPSPQIIEFEQTTAYHRRKHRAEVDYTHKGERNPSQPQPQQLLTKVMGDLQIAPIDRVPESQWEIHHRSTGNFHLVEVQWQGIFKLEQNALNDCYIIDLVLAGSLEQTIDAPQARFREHQQTCCCSLDTATIIGPGQKLASIASPVGKVLSIEIDRVKIESVLGKLLNRTLKQPISFQTSIDLTSNVGQSLKKFLHFLWESTPGLGTDRTSLVFPELEEAFLAFIVRGLPNNYSEEILDRSDGALASHVRKAQAFIESHLHEDIKLGDIAAATSICTRLLQKAFSDRCGCSPMRFLTRSRLERIHQELERAPSNTKIVDVMMDYGFTQGGKFAKEYQQLFGEKPSDTLKRSSQFHQQHSPLWQDLDDTRADRVTGGAVNFLPSMLEHTPHRPKVTVLKTNLPTVAKSQIKYTLSSRFHTIGGVGLA